MKRTMQLTVNVTTRDGSGNRMPDVGRMRELFPKIEGIIKAGGTAGRFEHAFTLGDEGYCHVTVEFDTKAGPVMRSGDSGHIDMRDSNLSGAESYYNK